MLTESIIALLLIGISVVIHCGGILVLGAALVRRRGQMERRAGRVHSALMILIGVFGALMFLHIVENCIWAAFYNGLGLFGNYETSLYFSFGTYSTIGYGDVLLPQKWRLLGSLEGISGVLLCGLSGAFLFAVVNALFQFRIQRMSQETVPPDQP